MKQEIKKNKSPKVKSQMFCAKISRKKGFSLIESLIAIFIFSLVAAMLAGAFSGFLKNYVSAKKEQRSAESAQYAMNLMAKTIRTSTLDASSLATPGQISLFDNSQGKCIFYGYDLASGKIQTNSTSAVADISQCAGNWIGISDLTSVGEIKAMTFSGMPTADPLIGKVTIAISAVGNTPTTSSQVQTTVSLRNNSTVNSPPPILTWKFTGSSYTGENCQSTQPAAIGGTACSPSGGVTSGLSCTWLGGADGGCSDYDCDRTATYSCSL